MIKIIVADDHPVVREGLKFLIEQRSKNIKVVGIASNGNEVIDLAESKSADVFLLDIIMPYLNGLETAERLLKIDKKNKVIILTMHNEENFVSKALRIGVRGYLTKESDIENIIHAIHEVYSGKYYMSPIISKFIVHGYLGKNSLRFEEKIDLTGREKEILQLIGEGYSSKRISKILSIAYCTVCVHKKNIMKKLDMHKQADLIRYAIREGIAKL
jgi:two-component system, NarL family, response regulator NreC